MHPGEPADLYHLPCPTRLLWRHQFQQTARMLKDTEAFQYDSSMWTVKTLLSTTEVDDARPTFV